MAITDVKDCVMQIIVVTVQEQEKGNVHVDKLVSMLSELSLSFESPIHVAGLVIHIVRNKLGTLWEHSSSNQQFHY